MTILLNFIPKFSTWALKYISCISSNVLHSNMRKLRYTNSTSNTEMLLSNLHINSFHKAFTKSHHSVFKCNFSWNEYLCEKKPGKRYRKTLCHGTSKARNSFTRIWKESWHIVSNAFVWLWVCDVECFIIREVLMVLTHRVFNVRTIMECFWDVMTMTNTKTKRYYWNCEIIMILF